MTKKVAKKERRAPLRWVELTAPMLKKLGTDVSDIAKVYKYSRGTDAFPAVLLVHYEAQKWWRVYQMATFQPHSCAAERYKRFYRAQSFCYDYLEDAKTAAAKWAKKMTAYT